VSRSLATPPRVNPRRAAAPHQSGRPRSVHEPELASQQHRNKKRHAINRDAPLSGNSPIARTVVARAEFAAKRVAIDAMPPETREKNVLRGRKLKPVRPYHNASNMIGGSGPGIVIPRDDQLISNPKPVGRYPDLAP
jgi:hypothetical protein